MYKKVIAHAYYYEGAMLNIVERTYDKEIPRNTECILASDIGGTNSNFGVFRHTNGQLELLLSLHVKSQEITDFTAVVQQLLAHLQNKYGITIKKSGFAAAGVVSEKRDYSKPTNANFAIDAQDILAKTDLQCTFLANDFEVIGYGLDKIKPSDLVLVNKGTPRRYANKVILGAGTGLGKCIMTWNKELNRHIPLASEGGHADFCPQEQLELDLALYIRNNEKRVCNISWEDVLAGHGIQRLYRFFHDRTKHKESSLHNGPHPDEIFASRQEDAFSWQTFELYSKLYARCAKNFALDALALGGVYIAGGIAAKNLQLFQESRFMTEFLNCGKQQALLQQVPIYVITDYNISLYGTAAFMHLEGMCD